MPPLGYLHTRRARACRNSTHLRRGVDCERPLLTGALIAGVGQAYRARALILEIGSVQVFVERQQTLRGLGLTDARMIEDDEVVAACQLLERRVERGPRTPEPIGRPVGRSIAVPVADAVGRGILLGSPFRPDALLEAGFRTMMVQNLATRSPWRRETVEEVAALGVLLGRLSERFPEAAWAPASL